MAEKTTRELLEKTIEGMKSDRQPFEADWEEIGRLALPNKTDVRGPSRGATNDRRRANTASHDTGGHMAARRLTNGFATGLTSSAQMWFVLALQDRDLMEFHPVKEWLEIVQRQIYWFFSKTNYYDMTKMQYADIGVFGIGAQIALEHREYLGVYHHLPVGSYFISVDEGMRTNRLVRYTRPTVEQLYHQVNGDTTKITRQVKNAYDKSEYNVLVPCVHVIESNIDGKGNYRSPNVQKPWRSIKWEIDQNEKNILLSEKGYDSKPFTAPRWETVGMQVYCETSPGFAALPDMRELQLIARRAARAMDNMVKPALAAPAGLARSFLSLDPGTVNYIDAMSGDAVKPILQPDVRTLEFIRADREARTRRINELFHADLFMAITEMEGVQPRNEQELLYRNEEKLTQLGPVVDRLNIEKLEQDIDRAYTILKNLGMLPPIPEEMHGQPLQIEFVSVLARAQKATDNTNIERIARFVGFLTGQFPDAALKFDAQQAVDEYATSLNVTPKIIRSDEIVAQMAQQMQQRQQAEQTAAMAPAMKDGAQAAELLSRTQVDDQGTSALQRMLGA